jgi:hypothetical protein
MSRSKKPDHIVREIQDNIKKSKQQTLKRLHAVRKKLQTHTVILNFKLNEI